MALSAVSGSGTQSSTQNPQSSAPADTGGTQSSSLQPGTTSSLLTTDNGGVPLTAGSLSTVSLGTTTGQIVSNPPVKHHHANPVWVGVVIGLFVLAVAMFWLTSRTAKITTK